MSIDASGKMTRNYDYEALVEDVIIEANNKFKRSICIYCNVEGSVILKLDEESSSVNFIIGKGFLNKQRSIIQP